MASEAQRLIGISLTKIAQSRSHRGGVSLHKNLLVATVLQKARYIFMEEAYNMVHYHHHQQQQAHSPSPVPINIIDEELVGLTAEEAGIETTGLPDDPQESLSVTASHSGGTNSCGAGAGRGNLQDFLQQSTQQQQQSACVKCAQNNKENHPPSSASPPPAPYLIINSSTTTTTTTSTTEQLTYLDLDNKSSTTTNNNILLRNNNNTNISPCLKRRRAIAEWETEEAVQSILPKRERKNDDDTDDSVFLDADAAATILADVVSKELIESNNNMSSAAAGGGGGSAMEIDRITSLVSIFSFSMGGGDAGGVNNNSNKQLINGSNRSMSSPDLCSTQAKDAGDTLQQRPFLAMTV